MTYKINQLNGYAWECAINNVLDRLNKNQGNLTIKNDWKYAQDIAFDFDLLFDENGAYLCIQL